MLVVETVPTTSRIDELIYKVAALIQSESRGHLELSKQGGEVLVYDKSNESMNLSREYFGNLWSTAENAVKGVKLEKPERTPTVLHQRKGCIVISSEDVGVIIPIRSADDILENKKINIKSGNTIHDCELAPHQIIVVYGDTSAVSIAITVPFNLILHPRSSLVASET